MPYLKRVTACTIWHLSKKECSLAILFALTFREFRADWLIISKLALAGACYVPLSTTGVDG